jgi:hypothetical protein
MFGAFKFLTAAHLLLPFADTSVLENHHCSVGFALIERSGIQEELKEGEYKALRKLMVNAILSTDMSVHKDLLAKVVLRATRETVRGSGAGGFSRASSDDRSLLVSFLLHTADLCNPCLPPAMSYRIANELAKEFARQAELEHAAGLPITVMLSDTAVGKAKLELGFIGARLSRHYCRRGCVCGHASDAAHPPHSPDFVVAPLYVMLAIIAPGCGPRCLWRINANRDMWTRIVSPPLPRARHSVAVVEPVVQTAASITDAFTILAKATAETARAAAADTAAKAAGIVYVDEAMARARVERQRFAAKSLAAANASASIAASVAATARAEMHRVAAAVTASAAKDGARVIATAAEAAAAAGASSHFADALRCALCTRVKLMWPLTRLYCCVLPPHVHSCTFARCCRRRAGCVARCDGGGAGCLASAGVAHSARRCREPRLCAGGGRHRHCCCCCLHS